MISCYSPFECAIPSTSLCFCVSKSLTPSAQNAAETLETLSCSLKFQKFGHVEKPNILFLSTGGVL